jgi:hypothetical protein
VRARAAAALAAGALLWLAAPALAAGPPLISESFVTSVTATGATLRAKIDPNGSFTTFRFEYITEDAYQANIEAIPPRAGFFDAAKIPSEKEAPGLVGTTPLEVSKSPGGLLPATVYRYRVLATNSNGTTPGPERAFATQGTAQTFGLPDGRGWELVSPLDKGGGAIAAPGSLFGGGDFQAAEGGGSIVYGSATAFGQAQGAPPASQYLSTRSSSGWATQDLSAPLASAAYGDHPGGAPYRLFSEDLSKGLLFGGRPCRGDIVGCPVPNPVLPGSGAPQGFMAYYLRSANGSFFSLLVQADLAHSSVSPEAFEASLAAASPDLAHLVLSSCAKLTADATEVMIGPGECDPQAQNLYEWSSPGGLKLLNLLPPAQIAAPIGALSGDGSRVYWTHAGDLYLRDGTQSTQVDEAKGGGGAFQAASSDGSIAFFSKEGHLYRFSATTKATTDLTPSGEVVGVLGASQSGAEVYYQDATGIERWHEGTITQVAQGAQAALQSDYYPPTVATSRISADGSHLAFLSAKELSGFDNAGRVEVYLYGPPPAGGAPQLRCASCNPTGERAQGSSSIPAALLNGSTMAYRPRALSANGNRLFFDSDDKLVVEDTDERPDVYEWEAKGIGDCTRSPGCLSLISSGRSPKGASFIDASADGSDVYFITDGSLVGSDPGSIDLYDARVGGGFGEATKPIPCIADACQSLPVSPEDPDPGTLIKSSGNPPQSFATEKKKKKPKKKGHQGKKKHGKGNLNSKGKYHVPVGRGASR